MFGLIYGSGFGSGLELGKRTSHRHAMWFSPIPDAQNDPAIAGKLGMRAGSLRGDPSGDQE